MIQSRRHPFNTILSPYSSSADIAPLSPCFLTDSDHSTWRTDQGRRQYRFHVVYGFYLPEENVHAGDRPVLCSSRSDLCGHFILLDLRYIYSCTVIYHCGFFTLAYYIPAIHVVVHSSPKSLLLLGTGMRKHLLEATAYLLASLPREVPGSPLPRPPRWDLPSEPTSSAYTSGPRS